MTKIEKYGFFEIRSLYLKEIDAQLYEFEHKKSGASLIYINRKDENKTFSIGFATPPENDTGVFHIIEHSVLCGSKKYPLKDPFAELLKGSLNTFLNAITYEDRTVYPVSSRCEKDFLNLVDVYMDAVLSPNFISNPCIFNQEGWHYEYDGDSDSLSINGVVYNEMKGAYSSAEELGLARLNKLLYDGCLYGHDSGGDPDFIPSLTYDYFKKAHAKYYHPSNARMILDGEMDLDKLLQLIDSHLSAYDRGERVSLDGRSEARISPVEYINYGISENESKKGRARVLYGFVYSDHSDREAHIGASLLCDLLCGSNASPLKKALLDAGLAKDAAMYSVKSREQTVVLEIRDADEERLEEIHATVEGVIRKISEEGIDKKKLVAALNSIEFKLCERDYGTLPTGIAFAMSVYGSWIYGGLPENALSFEDVIKKVRDRIDEGYFDSELLNMTVDNPHRATLVMLPDSSYGEKRSAKEKERLSDVLKSMSKTELEKIKKEQDLLKKWQRSEATDEELECLPQLLLSDIPKKTSRPKVVADSLNGVKIFRNTEKVNGIVYISLYFDASDLVAEELCDLSTLSSALINFPTKSYDVLSLQNEIKSNLGTLFASFGVGKRDGVARPYLKIGASALSSKADALVGLIGELLSSEIEDCDEMKKLVSQIRSNIEEGMISSGEALAISRAEASSEESGAISEYLSGYECYRVLSEYLARDGEIAALTDRVNRLLRRLAVKERLSIFITGEISEDALLSLTSSFDRGDAPTKRSTALCAKEEEFISLPSQVSYAVMGGKSKRIKDNLGLMRVARSILSYEYLWNTVRVQNGAYGTGFLPRKDGSLVFYSYRDPSPEASLGYYREASNYLRALAESGEDITKFVIGAFGEFDMIITPRTASAIAAADYLNGWSEEDEIRTRRDMLAVKTEDLRLAADIIDDALSAPRTVIVGSEEHLAAMNTKPKNIIKI